ncbi:MAG: hypothetical protein NTV88_00115 [Candidatus Micrarchaeota archaeon]|nr:hypothetical protein [Candidatus Micrarchaeota archaeon]
MQKIKSKVKDFALGSAIIGAGLLLSGNVLKAENKTTEGEFAKRQGTTLTIGSQNTFKKEFVKVNNVYRPADYDSSGVQYGERIINLSAFGKEAAIVGLGLEKLDKAFTFNETWRTTSKIVDHISISTKEINIDGRALVVVGTGREGIFIIFANENLDQIYMTVMKQSLVFKGDWDQRLHYQEKGISDPILLDVSSKGISWPNSLGDNRYQMNYVPLPYPKHITFQFNERGKTADWKTSIDSTSEGQNVVYVKNGDDIIAQGTVFQDVGSSFSRVQSKISSNGVTRSSNSYSIKNLNEKRAIGFGTSWKVNFSKEIGEQMFSIPLDRPGFETVGLGLDMNGATRQLTYFAGQTNINDTTYLVYIDPTRNKIAGVLVPISGNGGGVYLLDQSPLDISDVDRVLNLLVRSNGVDRAGWITGDSKRKGKDHDFVIAYDAYFGIKVRVDLLEQLSHPEINVTKKGLVQALSNGDIVQEVGILDLSGFSIRVK